MSIADGNILTRSDGRALVDAHGRVLVHDASAQHCCDPRVRNSCCLPSGACVSSYGFEYDGTRWAPVPITESRCQSLGGIFRPGIPCGPDFPCTKICCNEQGVCTQRTSDAAGVLAPCPDDTTHVYYDTTCTQTSCPLPPQPRCMACGRMPAQSVLITFSPPIPQYRTCTQRCGTGGGGTYFSVTTSSQRSSFVLPRRRGASACWDYWYRYQYFQVSYGYATFWVPGCTKFTSTSWVSPLETVACGFMPSQDGTIDEIYIFLYFGFRARISPPRRMCQPGDSVTIELGGGERICEDGPYRSTATVVIL